MRSCGRCCLFTWSLLGCCLRCICKAGGFSGMGTRGAVMGRADDITVVGFQGIIPTRKGLQDGVPDVLRHHLSPLSYFKNHGWSEKE